MRIDSTSREGTSWPLESRASPPPISSAKLRKLDAQAKEENLTPMMAVLLLSFNHDGWTTKLVVDLLWSRCIVCDGGSPVECPRHSNFQTVLRKSVLILPCLVGTSVWIASFVVSPFSFSFLFKIWRRQTSAGLLLQTC